MRRQKHFNLWQHHHLSQLVVCDWRLSLCSFMCCYYRHTVVVSHFLDHFGGVVAATAAAALASLLGRVADFPGDILPKSAGSKESLLFLMMMLLSAFFSRVVPQSNGFTSLCVPWRGRRLGLIPSTRHHPSSSSSSCFRLLYTQTGASLVR